MRRAGRLALVTMSSLLAACGSSSGSSPPAGPAPDADLNGDQQAGDAGVPGDATISDGPLVDDASMEAGPGLAEDAGDAAIRGDAGEGEDGATTDSGLVVPPDASLGAVTAISAGSVHTCALKSDGTVSCWGNNRAGEIGTNAAATLGTNTPQTYAVQVAGLSSVTAISAGLETTCGILSSGALSCLGSSFGPPAMGDLYTPAPIAGLTGVTQVSLGTGIAFGNDSGCVLLTGGAVKCLDPGTDPDSGLKSGVVPVAVSGLGSGVVALSSGDYFSCVVLSGGTAKCWGDNYEDALGDGMMNPSSPTPQPVVGLTGVTAVAAGSGHACALLSDGTVSCWGDNTYGELGNSSIPVATPTPVQVTQLSGATAITAGMNFSCALLTGGTVECWGDNRGGQLGNGGAAPVGGQNPPVTGIHGAVAVSAGDAHACALLADGTVACWGINGDGQLGDGTTTTRMVPVQVR